MTGFIGRRERTDGGFTLVELLIVMIILAILMSIAIPTFLNHKSKALATNAKANISLAQKAMESCAAGNTMGVFKADAGGTGPGSLAFDCSSTLALDETSLAPMLPPNMTSTQPGAMWVTVPDQYSYTVSANTASAPDQLVTFVLTRTNDGLTKTCVSANAEAKRKVCPTNTW